MGASGQAGLGIGIFLMAIGAVVAIGWINKEVVEKA